MLKPKLDSRSLQIPYHLLVLFTAHRGTTRTPRGLSAKWRLGSSSSMQIGKPLQREPPSFKGRMNIATFSACESQFGGRTSGWAQNGSELIVYHQNGPNKHNVQELKK